MEIHEVGPKHSTTYREDILLPLFTHIEGADSFCVVGAASMGKTRLMDHIMRSDVQKHYLGDKASNTWIIRVDINRMPAGEEWNFYELLLSSMMLSCSDHEDDFDDIENLRVQLIELDTKVIESRDFLRALRFFELAVNMLCQSYKLNICFLLDEFDEMYRTMPRQLFEQLRSVRDANKNRLCYGLFMRHLPQKLRAYEEIESFRELLSHRAIGITPYGHADATRMLQQLEDRKQHRLTAEQRDWIIAKSGGHPGTIVALIDLFIKDMQAVQKMNDIAWFVNQNGITDECDKIWNGLLDDEKAAMLALAQGKFQSVNILVREGLLAKGLIIQPNQKDRFFSPLFEEFLRGQLP